MKKIMIFFIAVCMGAGSLNAQMYLRLGVGGGIGLGQYEGANWANQTTTDNTNNYEFKRMGLGGGLNANLAAGFMLSDNFGIELGVNEFIGLNKKIHISDTRTNYTESTDVKISGSMLQIVPAIIITPKLEKINPYARVGLIVGILPSIVEQVNSTQTDNFPVKATSATTTVIEYKEKNSGGIGLGFTAAAGVSLALGEKLSFFGELVFNGITYAPTKGKVKTWTVDGKDMLPDATTRQKEWTFEKSYDADQAIPDGSADKRDKQSFNFSNAEINIGIKLSL